ncbi:MULTISPECIES: CDP-alcohol phosphatidyltransferase family protein [Niastella]|uniref:CDP-alcohol phosphatidyltransferase family protein n=1 Tax=Niastella soli TaxID=2821487 RepID=A0ABS3Z0Y0_9BACT|nr:CDP-alcohol phosphatidyltransferase family protein [Niastella soli]MBO9203754.1 CDP-alcohol phosphatidyltransferase family protein [Niastella soli]
MKKNPVVLIYSRLLMGVVILLLSVLQVEYYNVIAIILFTTGLLTDIFDGIIARRLNISTERLRRLDSSIDQVFFISVTIATYLQCKAFFYSNYIMLAILLGTEALTYVISFIKLKKEVATHAISSKIWTLFLFATLIHIMVDCNAGILFQWCFYVGMISRLEIVAILLLLPKWTNDVPSVYHAILLRKGKEIRRHKLFNG